MPQHAQPATEPSAEYLNQMLNLINPPLPRSKLLTVSPIKQRFLKTDNDELEVNTLSSALLHPDMANAFRNVRPEPGPPRFDMLLLEESKAMNREEVKERA